MGIYVATLHAVTPALCAVLLLFTKRSSNSLFLRQRRTSPLKANATCPWRLNQGLARDEPRTLGARSECVHRRFEAQVAPITLQGINHITELDRLCTAGSRNVMYATQAPKVQNSASLEHIASSDPESDMHMYLRKRRLYKSNGWKK
jgi:hypothetical protein